MFQRARGHRTTRLSHALAMVLLVASPGTSRASPAEVYRWIDETGGVHYGERWNAPRGASRLDIALRGNGPPDAALGCQSIQCRYERLRSDGERLRRNQRESDAAWERERAERERLAARQREAGDHEHAATAERSGRWMLPRWGTPRPASGNRRPTERQTAPVDQGSRLRTPPPGASPVRPLR